MLNSVLFLFAFLLRSITCLILLFAVLVKSQDEVMCYTEGSCGGVFEMSSIEACCDHRLDPSGLSYSISISESCTECPSGKNSQVKVRANDDFLMSQRFLPIFLERKFIIFTLVGTTVSISFDY